MNIDNIFIILVTVTIFIVLWGGYVVLYGKKDQAQENIHQLLSNKPAAGGDPGRQQQQEVVLKRHRKDEQSFLAQLEIKLALCSRPRNLF
jgi:hypothetical protein